MENNFGPFYYGDLDNITKNKLRKLEEACPDEFRLWFHQKPIQFFLEHNLTSFLHCLDAYYNRVFSKKSDTK